MRPVRLASGRVDHVDDLTPGSGRRTPPRARLRTDAPQLSLDGEWDFRWAPGGEPDGRPRSKFATLDEMLAVLGR